MKNISYIFLSLSKNIAFFITAFCLCVSFAKAADPYQAAPVSQTYSDPGICAHQHVLSRVDYQFRQGMRKILKLKHIRISEIANIRMTEFAPALPGSKFQRTFCSAVAIMNDNTQRNLWYMVEQGKGLSGIDGIRVQECVEGLDPWRISNGFCTSVKR